LQELALRKEQIGDDLVGGRDDPALVGRGVAHDDDTPLLQPDARLGGDEGVGSFDDGPGGRCAIGQEKALPVVDVDGLGTSAAGDEQVGRGVEDQAAELAGELVNGYPLLNQPAFSHGYLAVERPQPLDRKSVV